MKLTAAFVPLAALSLGLAVGAAGPPAVAQTLPTLPPVTVPTVTLPPVTLPPVTLPPATLPAVTVPTLPGGTLPSLPVTLPTVPLTVPTGVLPGALHECAHFVTQQAAQLSLDANPLQAPLLDPDGDGKACPLLGSGPAVAPASGQAGSGGTAGPDAGRGTTVSGSGNGAGSLTSDGSGSTTAEGVAGRSGSGGQGAAGPGETSAQAAAATGPSQQDEPDSTGPWLILALLAVLLALGGNVAAWRRSRSFI